MPEYVPRTVPELLSASRVMKELLTFTKLPKVMLQLMPVRKNAGCGKADQLIIVPSGKAAGLKLRLGASAKPKV